MVSEVVEHRDTARDANGFETPFDPLEVTKSDGQIGRADASVGANRHRRQRVAHVVDAEQRRLERAEWLAGAPHLEVRRPLLVLDVVRVPGGLLAHAKGFHRRGPAGAH